MLPSGYVAMVDMVMTKNDEFQQLATAELRRCQLGPFADGGEPEPAAPKAPSRLAGIPAWLRGLAMAAAVVAFATFGARLVGDGLPFDALWAHGLWNAWVLGAFVLVFWVENRIESSTGPLLGWSVALSLLVALGLASEGLVALL